jgi:4-diphosphocytidyl-2-C-methyl-D-erythritol kinase
VPFLIRGGTAVGSGRGERLAPVLARGSYHWVFAISDIGLSTPEVYAECDRLRGAAKAADVQPEPTSGLMSALRSGDPHILAPQLSNDLQDAAISLRPELGELLASGMEFGALGGIVSGSGPTVAFLVEDVESAIDLTVALTATGAAREVRKAIGPVHGAHVIPARVD